MSKEYPTIQQHEPLRTPSDWSTQGKRFIAQLEEILDDIYRRFNRLRLKDLDKSLQKTIVESEEGVAQLTIDVGEISTSVENLSGDVSEIEQTAAGIETRVSTAEGNISSLQQTASGLETRVSTAEGNISTVTQTAEGLTTRVETAESTLTTVAGTVDNLSGDVSSLSDAVDGLDGTVDTLSGNLSDLSSTVNTLDGDVDTLSGTVTTLSSSVSEVQQTATSLTTRIGTAEGNISSMSSDLAAAQGDISDMLEDITGISSDLSDLGGTVTSLSSDVSEIEQTASSLTTRVSNVEGSITSLSSDVTGIQGDVSDLQDDVGDLGDDLSTLGGTVTSLSSSVSEIEQTATSLTTRVGTVEGTVTSLSTDLSTAQGDITSLTSDLNSLSSDVTGLSGDLGTLASDIQAAQGDITDLQSDVSDVTGDVGDLQSDLSTLEGTVTSLGSDFNTLDASVTTISSNVSTLQQTTSGLTSDVSSLQGSVTTISGDLTTLDGTVTSVSGSVTTLQSDVSSLQQTASGLTSTVSSIQGSITTINSDIGTLNTGYTTLSGSVSTIDQKADAIALSVGRIQVSGSNLILDADKEVSNTDYNVAEWAYFEELTPREIYTFTICLTPAPQASVPYYRLFLSGGLQPVTTRLDGTSGNITPTGTAKQILKLPFKFSDSGYSGTNHVMRLYRPENTTVSDATTVHWAKLEKGTQTSDSYVPPPNGGDNLLYDSNVQMVASDSSNRWFGDWQCDELVVGETYTFSACIKPGSDHTSFSLNVHGGGELVNVISYKTGGYKQVVSGTFVFTGYTNANRLIACWRRPATVTTAGTLYWAKLCRGVNREAWSPNPNEINNSSIKITNQGIDILTDGTLNMSGGVEGSLLLPNGTITGLNGSFDNLTVGGKRVGSQIFFLTENFALTHGASSAPSGFHGFWLNATGSTVITASRSGSTSVGYLPRTFTLNAPTSTLSNGTFNYVLTFGVTNRQNSNPNSISFAVTATISGVTFTSDTITLQKWQTQTVSIPVTSTTNLFSSTSTLSVAFSSNWSGTSGLGPDLDGSGMTLTAQKSGTSGAQDVTIKFIP